MVQLQGMQEDSSAIREKCRVAMGVRHWKGLKLARKDGRELKGQEMITDR